MSSYLSLYDDFVRKVTMPRKPKFELGKLMNLHDKGRVMEKFLVMRQVLKPKELMDMKLQSNNLFKISILILRNKNFYLYKKMNLSNKEFIMYTWDFYTEQNQIESKCTTINCYKPFL
jgi:hypothetical protein